MSEDSVTLDEKEELAMGASARGAVYGVLSRFFLHPPDTVLLEAVRTEFIPFLQGANLSDEVAKSLEGLQKLLAQYDENMLIKIGSDYTLLIQGIRAGDSPPPPFESLYRGGTLFGEATQTVVKSYSAFDIGPLGKYEGVPPDHLGLELAFMKFLCLHEAEGWRNNDADQLTILEDAQTDFLSKHLGDWPCSFLKKVKERDDTGFYTAVLELTVGWVQQEIDRGK